MGSCDGRSSLLLCRDRRKSATPPRLGYNRAADVQIHLDASSISSIPFPLRMKTRYVPIRNRRDLSPNFSPLLPPPSDIVLCSPSPEAVKESSVGTHICLVMLRYSLFVHHWIVLLICYSSLWHRPLSSLGTGLTLPLVDIFGGNLCALQYGSPRNPGHPGPPTCSSPPNTEGEK